MTGRIHPSRSLGFNWRNTINQSFTQTRQNQQRKSKHFSWKDPSEFHHTVQTIEQDSVSSSAPVSLIKSFQQNVEGEWRGSMCSFDSNGEKIPLPHLYIPDAYKEWGLELYDWQTHCSMEATDDELKLNIKTLFTGIGCESDTVASEQLSTKKFTLDSIRSNGSYCLQFANKTGAEIEACFVMEPRLKRLRIALQFTQSSDREVYRLTKMNLFSEQWLGGLLDSDVDITEDSTRIRDVSSMDKTILTEEQICQIRSSHRALDHDDVITLHNGVFVTKGIWNGVLIIGIGFVSVEEEGTEFLIRSFGSCPL